MAERKLESDHSNVPVTIVRVMSELEKNAIAFLQRSFPKAAVISNECTFLTKEGTTAFKTWPLISQDVQSGVKQRALAVADLGGIANIYTIAHHVPKIFEELDSSMGLEISNVNKPAEYGIKSTQMAWAPRIILYTDRLHIPIADVFTAFGQMGFQIDVVDESTMHQSLFISYGGPDTESAEIINKALKDKGVKTWFFPDDAPPGEKLHRMMHDGVNKHDRVLLICSEQALTRPGVQNEIERVLEREAREGGSTILIPITLDDYVYGNWAPARQDIADQVKARVITKISVRDATELEAQIGKVANALRK